MTSAVPYRKAKSSSYADKAVLVVTHDYELAALWCDRIIALEDELHNEQGEEEDRLAWTSM